MFCHFWGIILRIKWSYLVLSITDIGIWTRIGILLGSRSKEQRVLRETNIRTAGLGIDKVPKVSAGRVGLEEGNQMFGRFRGDRSVVLGT